MQNKLQQSVGLSATQVTFLKLSGMKKKKKKVSTRCATTIAFLLENCGYYQHLYKIVGTKICFMHLVDCKGSIPTQFWWIEIG